MSHDKPALYVARLLPDPVMTHIRQRFTLVSEPNETSPSPADVRTGLAEADAAIVTLTERIDESALEQARRLKIVANYAVGYNNIDVAAAEQRDVVVSNTPDVLTDATADLAWALILATARRLVEGDQLVRSTRWTGWAPTQLLGTAVTGKTLGIVGMGRIGQAVARRAAGFDMQVLYHSRHPIPSPPGGAPWRMKPFPSLLAEADFISIHVPLSPDTHHLIGEKELAHMRETAILINTARGPIVDETALVTALRNGTIAGAGLDVFEDEPNLHAGLSELQQVVLLPHLGSATLMTRVKMGLICLDNIHAILAGRQAPNRVRPRP